MITRHKNKIKELLYKYGVQQVDKLLQEIDDILSDKIIENELVYQGFNIGDKVIISKIKNVIISYDGKPEGFSEEDIGKVGIIVKFDKKTMSQKNVFVDVDGVILCGDYLSLSKIKE